MACKVPTSCLTSSCSDPITVDSGAVFTPYVKIDFGQGNILSTGNPRGGADAKMNTYSGITSFQYGFTPGTPGLGCEVEVIDTDGSLSGVVGFALSKTFAETGRVVEFDFGWIVAECNGFSHLRIASQLTQKTLKAICVSADQTFEGNNVKYKISLKPQHYAEAQYSKDIVIGDDKEGKVSLKQALITLFTEYAPKYNAVLFKDRFGAELKFSNSTSDKPGEGPMAKWATNQQNPFSVARSWLSSIVSKDNRGILILYDPSQNALIFQEDPTDYDSKCCPNDTIGTYIVNGGNCSPVLEFTPTINWFADDGIGAGGTPSGAASGKMDEFIQPQVFQRGVIQESGSEVTPTIQEFQWVYSHPDDMAKDAAKAAVAHHQANWGAEVPKKSRPFSADLKIWGDPKFSHPEDLVTSSLGLIVINPWRIGNGCNWITSTGCNPMLSSNNYKIRGVSHQISGGSFTTTFNLDLVLPNVQLDSNDPIGGCGKTFDNSKPEKADENK